MPGEDAEDGIPERPFGAVVIENVLVVLEKVWQFVVPHQPESSASFFLFLLRLRLIAGCANTPLIDLFLFHLLLRDFNRGKIVAQSPHPQEEEDGDFSLSLHLM